MRRRWKVNAAILWAALSISQAADPPPLSLLALPKVELRKATETMGAAAENQKESANSSQAREELTASTGIDASESEIGVKVFETMNGAPLLSQIEMPDEPSGAIGWIETRVRDPVFAPEVVKIGKVRMSGGIVAAIKRKNPFCLLHPLAFVASW